VLAVLFGVEASLRFLFNVQEVTLMDESILQILLEELPDSFKQGQRLVEFLARNPKAHTVAVNQACAIGNISDVARRVNPYIHKHGFFISCHRPPLPIMNKFDEPSQMYEWSIHCIQEPANDSVYDAARATLS
jgi:hypothetical protein